jgi:hypothetical protein
MAKNRDADASRAKARILEEAAARTLQSRTQIGQSSIDLPYMTPAAANIKAFPK